MRICGVRIANISMEMVSVRIAISSRMEPISRNVSIVGLTSDLIRSSMRTISQTVKIAHTQSISGNATIRTSLGIRQIVEIVDISSRVNDVSIYWGEYDRKIRNFRYSILPVVKKNTLLHSKDSRKMLFFGKISKKRYTISYKKYDSRNMHLRVRSIRLGIFAMKVKMHTNATM